MKVSEFINNLAVWAAQSPDNGEAEVLLQVNPETCIAFERADDARGIGREHALVLVPKFDGRHVYLREMNLQ